MEWNRELLSWSSRGLPRGVEDVATCELRTPNGSFNANTGYPGWTDPTDFRDFSQFARKGWSAGLKRVILGLLAGKRELNELLTFNALPETGCSGWTSRCSRATR